MTRMRIGLTVRERPELARASLEALAVQAGAAEVVLLFDGADAAARAALPAGRAQSIAWQPARGLAACFNRLVDSGEADVYVLLEEGLRLGPGCLERLLRALQADPRHGLAGPSTNLCWNEQQAFAGPGGAAGELEGIARAAAQRFGDSLAYLEPLHSLAEFCYAVKREVVQAIGPADEGYGLGPCWEMDYNVRAARAGFRGVWVRGAYAWRAVPSPGRKAEEAARFEAAKRRYQDRFCGLRLRGAKRDYSAHCKGDGCPHFAPVQWIGPLRTKAAPAARSGEPPLRELVSCLMPTRNRRRYVPAAIDAFLRQDYEPRELVIVDDGDEPVADLVPRDPRIRYFRETQRRTLGAKRNLACGFARGEVLMHWDDDDWHAPWRISYQVAELAAHQADLCGLHQLWFYDPDADKAWHYRYPGGHTPWVAGGTFCYRRSLWERQRFADVNVGEDTRFVREATHARIVALARDGFYVARVHAGNTSAKHTGGASWHPFPGSAVHDLLGGDLAAFRSGSVRRPPRPLVSCIMPTFNRRPYVALSLRLFLAQDYPSKELIVVDDGKEAVEDLVAAVPGARYLRLAGRHSIGSKRNLACAQAAGEILVQWDDDDWYAPERVTRQVAPILAGRAELTGLEGNLVMSMPSGSFWALSAALHRRMFVGDVHGGTLAFAKSVWSAAQYPDSSLAEDAAFLSAALRGGKRLERVANGGLFAYHRHEHNAWALQVGRHVDARGWTRAAAPERMPVELIAAYRAAAQQLRAA
jgi:glycosyltransferase involved in cell wall biosynthesis